MTAARLVLAAGRLVAAFVTVRHLAGAAGRRAPVTPAPAASPFPSITVVVPARDEAHRIEPLLAAIVDAPDVVEVIVVDDESGDDTARRAMRAWANVVTGRPLPPRWAGKAWALQQGLVAATGEWVVMLDADTRPSPALPRALVARARADGTDLISAAGRFDCPTRALRWLHPALLTTLVYRGGIPGAARPGPVHRRVGNGQCVAARRRTLRDAGVFGAVAHHTVEDVALFRAMATAGYTVGFVDASELLTVRVYETATDAWTGWGRSLALSGVDPLLRQLGDLAVLALAQALPLVRLLARRADVLDLVLGVLRLGTLFGTASAYRRRGAGYWLSPTADLLAVAAVGRGILTRQERWRGRSYARRWRSAAR